MLQWGEYFVTRSWCQTYEFAEISSLMICPHTLQLFDKPTQCLMWEIPQEQNPKTDMEDAFPGNSEGQSVVPALEMQWCDFSEIVSRETPTSPTPIRFMTDFQPFPAFFYFSASIHDSFAKCHHCIYFMYSPRHPTLPSFLLHSSSFSPRPSPSWLSCVPFEVLLFSPCRAQRCLWMLPWGTVQSAKPFSNPVSVVSVYLTLCIPCVLVSIKALSISHSSILGQLDNILFVSLLAKPRAIFTHRYHP